MPRPCRDKHDLRPGACRVCWLSVNDARYQRHWGLPVSAPDRTPPDPRPGTPAASRPPTGARPEPCRHFVDTVKDRRGRGCARCWVYGCEVFGACVPGEQVEGVAHCDSCKHRKAEDDPMSDPKTAFAQVVLINLKRRPDRLDRFRGNQRSAGWPFAEPEVFAAIDGDKVGVPSRFTQGGGAWGCLRSHCAILEQAVMDDVPSVLVFEDDVCWESGIVNAVEEFMGRVPNDWDQIMFGGQHHEGAEKVCPGVVKCRNAQRTHAYAVRGPAMRDLLRLWQDTTTHIDHVMGPWQRDRKVYAPETWLFGQSGGKSDITGGHKPREFWTPPDPSLPVLVLDCPAAVVKDLRDRHGVHTGYCREPDTDFDVGLVAAAADAAPLASLGRWVSMILWEVASDPRLTAAVWHPAFTADMVRKVTSHPVVEVKVGTVGEAVEIIRSVRPSSD